MQLVPTPKPSTARNGTPWTDEDGDRLVDLVAEGALLEEVAEALERTPAPVRNRMRRMLPPEHRDCPVDRVLPTLQQAVADETYDWRKVIVQSPPPPPVRRVVRSGVAGIEADDLTQLTYALATSALPNRDELLQRMLTELGQRTCGFSDLEKLRILDLMLNASSPVATEAARAHAPGWVRALQHDLEPVFACSGWHGEFYGE